MRYITRNMRANIDAFACLAADLVARPTHLAEIVPEDPKCLGATDAAKPGMGGVYFLPEEGPCVWRLPFPKEVQRRLVSWENPKGDIHLAECYDYSSQFYN